MVETSKTGKQDNDISGIISDADIERARQQIGVPQYVRAKTYNPRADVNSMTHFAHGNGDDNPLYHDREYARSTRWGDLVAPPIYPISSGVCVTPKYDEEKKSLFKGLFKGVGKYHTVSEWDWYRPIYPGDELYFEHLTTHVDVKTSSFSNGRSVTEVYRTLYVNKLGEPVATRNETFASIERKGSKEGGKYKDFQRDHFSPEDIRKMDEVYAAEVRRGKRIRYWEDVEVGEALQPVAKGPLTITDIIFSHMARGWGGYGIGPLRYAWAMRQKMPAFFSLDEYGVPDNVQRLHWDYGWANKLGLPLPVDYGQNRLSWFTHLLTNWIGDDGWLYNINVEFRDFNFIGDFSICKGTVSGKREENGQKLVDIDIECGNQRGVITSPGKATVVLPSRESGVVILPRPPEELVLRGAQMMNEYRELKAEGKVE